MTQRRCLCIHLFRTKYQFSLSFCLFLSLLLYFMLSGKSCLQRYFPTSVFLNFLSQNADWLLFLLLCCELSVTHRDGHDGISREFLYILDIGYQIQSKVLGLWSYYKIKQLIVNKQHKLNQEFHSVSYFHTLKIASKQIFWHTDVAYHIFSKRSPCTQHYRGFCYIFHKIRAIDIEISKFSTIRIDLAIPVSAHTLHSNFLSFGNSPITRWKRCLFWKY